MPKWEVELRTPGGKLVTEIVEADRREWHSNYDGVKLLFFRGESIYRELPAGRVLGVCSLEPETEEGES